MLYPIILILSLIILPYDVIAKVDNINNMKKLADRGNAYAQFEVGKYFLERGNENDGVNYLNLACNNGFNPACEELRKIESSILAGLDLNNLSDREQLNYGLQFLDEKKYALAFKLFESLCIKGKNPVGCYFYGVCYARGWGIIRNLTKATQIFSDPILQNDPWAKFMLADVKEDEATTIYQ